MSRCIVGHTLYIFHYFNNVVRPHGSMFDSADSAPGDGCSSSKIIKGILLYFGCLFERIFLSAETSALKATTFYAQMETLIKYILIPIHTCRYMHIKLEYIQYTRRYWHIACMCIYLCVYVGINMYLSLYHTISQYLWVFQGINTICRFMSVLPVYISMKRYCLYE